MLGLQASIEPRLADAWRSGGLGASDRLAGLLSDRAGSALRQVIADLIDRVGRSMDSLTTST